MFESVSLSRSLYYLINRSHQSNHKDIDCKGRHLDCCIQLQNVVGERAEQFNRKLNKFEHSLNMMTSTKFYFNLLLQICNHNREINNKLLTTYSSIPQALALSSATFKSYDQQHHMELPPPAHHHTDNQPIANHE